MFNSMFHVTDDRIKKLMPYVKQKNIQSTSDQLSIFFLVTFLYLPNHCYFPAK